MQPISIWEVSSWGWQPQDVQLGELRTSGGAWQAQAARHPLANGRGRILPTPSRIRRGVRKLEDWSDSPRISVLGERSFGP